MVYPVEFLNYHFLKISVLLIIKSSKYFLLTGTIFLCKQKQIVTFLDFLSDQTLDMSFTQQISTF